MYIVNIIKRIYSNLLENRERRRYIQSFKRAAKDPEQKVLVEIGLEDFLDSIDHL